MSAEIMHADERVDRTKAMEVATTRAAQEVQAAMVIAKKFPRDHNAAFARIMTACRRPVLAEQAIYSYPKGGKTVHGPSIRLAEALAQGWGNIDYGVIELTQERGESSLMAYAWDLETNTRSTKVFTVKHKRVTRQGSTALTDPRDVYELTANQGARRVRACVLAVIPGDVVDEAVEECRKTLVREAGDMPIADRIRNMVLAFQEHGVTQEMIEARLGHNLDATTEHEIITLKGIFRSLKDNMSSREDHFDVSAGQPRPTRPATLDEKAAAMAEAKQEAAASPEADEFLAEMDAAAGVKQEDIPF